MSLGHFDTEAADAAERIQRLAKEQHDADFKWLASDPRGRRLLWQWMGQCLVFEPVFHPQGSVMNHNEGRRSVGLSFLNDINRICPEQFAVMAAENAPKAEETE